MKYSDPLALVRAAIEAVNRGDWDAVAALCDPVSVVAFQRQLVEQYEPVAPRHELTVEEYRRMAPDMPREVAEYQVAQHRAHTDPERRLREELPDVANVESLKALSPKTVFAAWLDGRGPRRQIARLAAEGRISPKVVAHSRELASHVYNYQVVGAVPDGERVAHVLYRHATDHESWDGELAKWLRKRPADEQELARDLSGRTHPQVATCRRQPDGGWLMLAGYDFLSLGNISFDFSETREPTPDAPGDDGASTEQ